MQNAPVPTLPLVLGGHTFIPELGNDPATDREAQARIVDACLDAGIRRFDTTYAPERIGLGVALEMLGRRDEADIIAWNFILEGDGAYLHSPAPYQRHHLAVMQEQLRTDRIDGLVVHRVGDETEDRRQFELAVSWMEAGHVGEIGVWAPTADPAAIYGEESAVSFMVFPCNVANPNTEVFAASAAMGWRCLATSPFNRGWLLDKMVARLAEDEGADRVGARRRLADAMLRDSLFAPHVDELIIGIRRVEWLAPNVESVRRGPLSPAERVWLESLAEAVSE